MKKTCCRRQFLKSGAVIAAGAACCGGVVQRAFAQGDENDTRLVAVLGDYDKIASSDPQLVKAVFEDAEGQVVEEEKVYIRWIKINDRASSWSCVSAICQHLKCKVNWEADANRFVCPCHGSEYDINGTNVKGPSKRDLPDYSEDVFTEDGKVKLKRYIKLEA